MQPNDQNPQSEKCPICLGKMKHDKDFDSETYKLDIKITDTKDTVVALIPCGHSFHLDCIVIWFNQPNNICPLCKREFVFMVLNPDLLEFKKIQISYSNNELNIIEETLYYQPQQIIPPHAQNQEFEEIIMTNDRFEGWMWQAQVFFAGAIINGILLPSFLDPYFDTELYPYKSLRIALIAVHPVGLVAHLLYDALNQYLFPGWHRH